MKNKKIIVSIILFISFIGICTISNASSLNMKELKIDAVLEENGDMKITEYWDIYISETNTLFKSFDLDSSRFNGFTDAKVKEVLKDGSEIEYTQIYEEMYHVTDQCYYGLELDKTKYEIAWGTGMEEDSGNKKYIIEYTVKNPVRNYNDCQELYWQFIGKEFEIPIKKITGTITLPHPVENIENLRIWAHGPLQGLIEHESNNKVVFEVSNFPRKTMLEVRVISEENIFKSNKNISNEDRLEKAIEEEISWANKANKEREIAKRYMMIWGTVLLVGYIGLNILFIGIYIKKIKKHKKIEKSIIEIKPEVNYDYFRDIPDETASPFEAILMLKGKGTLEIDTKAGEYISATILNLTLKGALIIDVDNNKKKDNIIIRLSNKENLNLSKDEQLLLKELESVSENTEEQSFTIKDFEKYLNKNCGDFLKVIRKMRVAAIDSAEEKNKYLRESQKELDKYNNNGILNIVVGIFMIWMPIVAILAFVCAGIEFKISKKLTAYTQEGENEKSQWNGLINYMNDFSLLKEKEVPELVLWEKYLVFATAFGIADKVIKQLKVVYPLNIEANQNMLNNSTYMRYVMMDNMNFDFSKSVINGIQSAYSSGYSKYYNSQMSSGSGGGGGFSSGGGGGIGGGGGGGR